MRRNIFAGIAVILELFSCLVAWTQNRVVENVVVQFVQSTMSTLSSKLQAHAFKHLWNDRCKIPLILCLCFRIQWTAFALIILQFLNLLQIQLRFSFWWNDFWWGSFWWCSFWWCSFWWCSFWWCGFWTSCLQKHYSSGAALLQERYFFRSSLTSGALFLFSSKLPSGASKLQIFVVSIALYLLIQNQWWCNFIIMVLYTWTNIS